MSGRCFMAGRPMSFLAALASWVTGCTVSAAGPPGVDGPPRAAVPVVEHAGEPSRKAAVLTSSRWRQAMFEFNAWLDDQPVYGRDQVRRIRGDLAARVMAMSSYEIDYLLDTLDAKVKILHSPPARDAQAWLGRYLAVMSDAERARVLRAVPSILDLSVSELEAAVKRVAARRTDVERARAQSLDARRRIEAFLLATRREATASRDRRAGAPSFSPYRGPPLGAAPFADAYDSPTTVGVGPWGSFMLLPVGAF